MKMIVKCESKEKAERAALEYYNNSNPVGKYILWDVEAESYIVERFVFNGSKEIVKEFKY